MIPIYECASCGKQDTDWKMFEEYETEIAAYYYCLGTPECFEGVKMLGEEELERYDEEDDGWD